MHNQKIEQLLEFLKDDPNDSFSLYALALEYEKSDSGKARQCFEELLKKHADYLATYYHAAGLYERLGEKDLAMETYRKGINLAMKQGKAKALAELRNALNMLMDGEEE